MSIYDDIAALYDKWFSTDPSYLASGPFYVSALSRMRDRSCLEIGVGTGRISLEAVRTAPVSMTGIDISPRMLAVCRERFDALPERQGTLRLVEGDAARLAYHEEFDGAVMPYHAITHLLTEDDVLSLFRGVFSALRPGGWFLLDDFSLNRESPPEWVNTDEPIPEYQDADVTISDHFQCDFGRNLMRVICYVNGTPRVSFTARWRDPGEIRAYAEQAGFEVLSLMGGFDGSAWTRESPEQIWLLRKPGSPDDAIPLPQFGAI